MPLIHKSSELPAWCEMHAYEIIALQPGETHTFSRLDKKEKLIVDIGHCTITFNDEVVQGQAGSNVDLLTADGEFVITDVTEFTRMVRIVGDWGEVTGGSGPWIIDKSDNPQDKGDPVDYEKNTNFDSHYHDYDEYWIFFEGRGIAVSERKTYEIGPGDCIATGMGHHHDLAMIFEPIRAAFFETTVGGKGRTGHLWEHTHGPAKPQPERV